MSSVTTRESGTSSTTIWLNLQEPSQFAQKPAQDAPEPANPARYPFGIEPARARAILAAEGRWPRRPRWWDREEAECDIYVIAALSDLWDWQPIFEAALDRYLG